MFTTFLQDIIIGKITVRVIEALRYLTTPFAPTFPSHYENMGEKYGYEPGLCSARK